MNFNLIAPEKFTTPAGTFMYPKLLEPDTKFHACGIYEVIIAMDASDPEVQQLAEYLDKYMEQHKTSLKAQAPQQKFKLVDTPWKFEDANGLACLVLKAKSKASGIDKEGRPWSRKPAMFAADGSVISHGQIQAMWSGTEGKVAFKAAPFWTAALGAGVTLRLEATQVLKLVESGSNASSHGFAAVEGGYTQGAPTIPAVPFNAEPIQEDDALF